MNWRLTASNAVSDRDLSQTLMERDIKRKRLLQAIASIMDDQAIASKMDTQNGQTQPRVAFSQLSIPNNLLMVIPMFERMFPGAGDALNHPDELFDLVDRVRQEYNRLSE